VTIKYTGPSPYCFPSAGKASWLTNIALDML
jgi:hypothetical protein